MIREYQNKKPVPNEDVYLEIVVQSTREEIRAYDYIYSQIMKLNLPCPREQSSFDRDECRQILNRSDGEFKKLELIDGEASFKCEYIYYCNLENNKMEEEMENIRVTTFDVDALAAAAERRAQIWFALLTSHMTGAYTVQILEKALGHLFCHQDQLLNIDMLTEFIEDLLVVLKILKACKYDGCILHVSSAMYVLVDLDTIKKMIQYCGVADVIEGIDRCEHVILYSDGCVPPRSFILQLKPVSNQPPY